MDKMENRGLVWGLLATLVMTAIMLVGVVTGMSPMPRPIPIALAALPLGAVAPPVLVATGAIAHFAYGGVAGGVFAVVLRGRAGLATGLGYGVLLWVIMQLAVLPLLGWGVFGLAITPRIAVATLVLHLVYGGVLGWGVARRSVAAGQAQRRAA